MGHGEIAGREPVGQRQSQRPESAANSRRCETPAPRARPRSCSAMLTPKPTYSSSPVGPAKRFGRMNHLRKAVAARADAGPDLAAAGGILGHRDDHRHRVSVPVGSGPPISRATCASHQPARLLEGLLDLADIDDGLAVREALREAPPDRDRQPAPILVRQQRAEAVVVEQSGIGSRRCLEGWVSLLTPSHAPATPRPYLDLPVGRKLTIFSPSLISATRRGRGTLSICGVPAVDQLGESQHLLQPLARDRADGRIVGRVGRRRRAARRPQGRSRAPCGRRRSAPPLPRCRSRPRSDRGGRRGSAPAGSGPRPATP